jgi:two-component system chemotaxis response regulator CheB
MQAKNEITRILIADDSALAREFLFDLLNDEPEVQIIGMVESGREAVEFCREQLPDLIMMDVDMPDMDGIEATRVIMAETPTPILIFSSRSDSSLSFEAVQAGALDVMAKPGLAEIPDWKRNIKKLIGKIQMFSRIKVVRHLRPSGPKHARAETAKTFQPKLVLVGASTGGPQALQAIFSGVPASFPAPIIVVQHMTKGFLRGMVTWLSGQCALKCVIPEHGDVLKAGTIYFAPEEIYCSLMPPGRIKLSMDLPKWTEHCPCVNHLFNSAASLMPSKTLAILLTGMGKDGAEGMLTLKKAGARTISQNQESSLIFGMPREAADIGAAQYVMSLTEINKTLKTYTGGHP